MHAAESLTLLCIIVPESTSKPMAHGIAGMSLQVMISELSSRSTSTLHRAQRPVA